MTLYVITYTNQYPGYPLHTEIKHSISKKGCDQIVRNFKHRNHTSIVVEEYTTTLKDTIKIA